jgi:Rap1a immunity proteins
MRSRKIWSAALSATLLILPAAVLAATTQDNFLIRTTADLVVLCTADQSDPMMPEALGFCQGFGVGVYRTLEATQAGLPRPLFCPPSPPPSRSAAIASFVAWVQANPSVAPEAPTDGILDYLEHTYPCAGAGR